MKGVQYTPYERHSLKKAVCEGRIESVRKIISSRSLYYSQEWSDASDGYALLCTAIEDGTYRDCQTTSNEMVPELTAKTKILLTLHFILLLEMAT